MTLRLTPHQIATVAHNAGFRGRAVATATAVALAESEGHPTAHNPIPPDNSYGLWQINMIGGLGPARRQEFGLSNNAQLFDPATNARAAYAISSHGRNFTAWSTYGSGAYVTHWPAAAHAAQQVNGGRLASLPAGSSGGGSAAGGGAFHAHTAGFPNPFSAAVHVEHFLADLTDPHLWLRVVYVVGGMLLIVGGVFMIDADLTKKAGSFVGGGAIGQKVGGLFGPGGGGGGASGVIGEGEAAVETAAAV